jgi:ATP-binding cassette, subfamily B, multidrug efflux pump
MPPVTGAVRFENISFHYSDDPTLVLDKVNLDVKPGETVAFVGETGAGKTTIVKLLTRFHDPTDGCVLVDGVDLRTVTQQSLRRQMGMVLQDPFLFSGTVKENILFGRLDANDEDVTAAAQAVGAHDFIVNLKNGYETAVEEGGATLSVGQRQLISFARALLANPRILILDEATSSVDMQTEQVIQKALARLLKGRTSLSSRIVCPPLRMRIKLWSSKAAISPSRVRMPNCLRNKASTLSYIRRVFRIDKINGVRTLVRSKSRLKSALRFSNTHQGAEK